MKPIFLIPFAFATALLPHGHAPRVAVLAAAQLQSAAAQPESVAAPHDHASETTATDVHAASGTVATTSTSTSRMVNLPAGSYTPLYAPRGPVTVKRFSLDATPVTRAQLAAHFGRTVPATESALPAVDVTRTTARAYCRAQDKRLPTLDEWEYAAAASRTRREGTADATFRQEILDLYTQPRTALRPVRSTFRNAYGAYDMHGLVWEWVESHQHAGHDTDEHDMSCAGSANGASATTDYAAFLRYAFRSGLADESSHENLGFRCAAN